MFLEIIAFSLLVRFNSYQNARIFSIRHAIVGRISKANSNYSNYLSLIEQNRELVEENARLYNNLPSSKYSLKNNSFTDSLNSQLFRYIPAKVINNSVNKQYNFITLDKGSINGIKPDMGVIGPNGLVGVVKTTTKHFSSVVPILNREFFPNARIKKTNFFGYIEWPGTNYREVKLKDIPLHARINIGDSIETSGFTATFPEGLLIGTISDFEIEKGVNYNILVGLSTDFKKLTNVWVIENLFKSERKTLEESITHD